MTRYASQPGSRLELLRSRWVAFSPVSGETVVLNDESVAVLDLLEHGDEATIGAMIANEVGLPQEQVDKQLRAVWAQLVDAGLIRPIEPAGTLDP